MKEIWKEFVDTIGFMGSVVLLLLIVPIGMVNAFGVVSGEGGFAVVFLLLACVVILYFWQKYNTKATDEAVSAIRHGAATQKQKGKFLSAEVAEMEQQKKQEHIMKLPYFYDIYSLYLRGHPREDLQWPLHKIKEQLKSDLLNRKRDNTFLMGLYYDDYVSDTYHTPETLLRKTVEAMMKEKKCSRSHLEEHYADELETMRWKITHTVLDIIFGGFGSVARVELKEDISGYSLVYPFGLPPLEYIFESDEEQEKAFIRTAIERLEECKTIARNMDHFVRERECAFRLTIPRFRQPQKGRSEK